MSDASPPAVSNFLREIVARDIAEGKHKAPVTRFPPELWFTPTLENYRQLFGRTDFLENTLNSFYVTMGSTALGLLLAVPAAYAISWHRLVWPATVTLFARMAPGTLFLLPWFLMFSNVGLSGTHFALIITHSVITVPIILWTMLPHFDALPRELTESAQIDGCRAWGALWWIVLPVVVPGLVVAASMAAGPVAVGDAGGGLGLGVGPLVAVRIPAGSPGAGGAVGVRGGRATMAGLSALAGRPVSLSGPVPCL